MVTGTEGEQREAFALPRGCHERYLQANGVSFHMVEAGSGRLVLLLHGFPEFWYSWRHQLVTLSRDFHVVAPDLRGYNHSDKTATGYDIATLTEDARLLMRALGEDRANVVGHDWGGVIAWAFAMRAPDVVERLAIINAPHPALFLRALRRPSQLARSSYIAFFQLRCVAERAIARNDYAAVRRILASAAAHTQWAGEEDIERYISALRRPGALTCALNYYRNIRPRYFGEISVGRKISRPTLVLWGELDPVLGVELLHGLEEWVPNASVIRYPQAGHWLNQELPKDINLALRTFFAAPEEQVSSGDTQL